MLRVWGLSWQNLCLELSISLLSWLKALLLPATHIEKQRVFYRTHTSFMQEKLYMQSLQSMSMFSRTGFGSYLHLVHFKAKTNVYSCLQATGLKGMQLNNWVQFFQSFKSHSPALMWIHTHTHTYSPALMWTSWLLIFPEGFSAVQ